MCKWASGWHAGPPPIDCKVPSHVSVSVHEGGGLKTVVRGPAFMGVGVTGYGPASGYGFHLKGIVEYVEYEEEEKGRDEM